jgi:hypothetical protein
MERYVVVIPNDHPLVTTPGNEVSHNIDHAPALAKGGNVKTMESDGNPAAMDQACSRALGCPAVYARDPGPLLAGEVVLFSNVEGGEAPGEPGEFGFVVKGEDLVFDGGEPAIPGGIPEDDRRLWPGGAPPLADEHLERAPERKHDNPLDHVEVENPNDPDSLTGSAVESRRKALSGDDNRNDGHTEDGKKTDPHAKDGLAESEKKPTKDKAIETEGKATNTPVDKKGTAADKEAKATGKPKPAPKGSKPADVPEAENVGPTLDESPKSKPQKIDSQLVVDKGKKAK